MSIYVDQQLGLDNGERRTLTSFALESSASMLVSIFESRVSSRRYQNVCIALSGHVMRVSTCMISAGFNAGNWPKIDNWRCWLWLPLLHGGG